jgi:hypothetical protein
MLKHYVLFCWSGFVALLVAFMSWAALTFTLALWPEAFDKLVVLAVSSALALVVFSLHFLIGHVALARLQTQLHLVRGLFRSNPKVGLAGLVLFAIFWAIKRRLGRTRPGKTP